MKARIVTKISERVLLFAIDNTVKAKLEVILQQLDIQSHTVTEGELTRCRLFGRVSWVSGEADV